MTGNSLPTRSRASSSKKVILRQTSQLVLSPQKSTLKASSFIKKRLKRCWRKLQTNLALHIRLLKDLRRGFSFWLMKFQKWTRALRNRWNRYRKQKVWNQLKLLKLSRLLNQLWKLCQRSRTSALTNWRWLKSLNPGNSSTSRQYSTAWKQ